MTEQRRKERRVGVQLRDLREYEGRSVAVVLTYSQRRVLAVGRLRRYKSDRDPEAVMLEPIDDPPPAAINGPGVIVASEVESICALGPRHFV